MNTKEKAKELINEFYPQVQWKLGQENCLERAKKCALIAVQEILKITLSYAGKDYDFWQEVKLEIEKL